MHSFKLKFTLLLFSAFLFNSCADTALSSLIVEYTETPMGIDVNKPRFSWQMVSKKRGQSQTAYQISVFDENGNETWDSGKIRSDISLNIEYEGQPLQPSTRYNWQLQVWDQNNKPLSANSWFETGLMNPSIDAWNGARWIGGDDDDLVFYPSYLPAFNINYTIQLNQQNGTTKAGFIFGANDARLMDKNKNIYNLQNEKDKSYIEVELDISKTDQGDNAFLNIYRAGYAPGDNPEKPLQSLRIPESIINNKNKFEKHVIYLKTMYSQTDFYINGENDENHIGAVVLNPLGNGWDLICFPLLCEIGFSAKPEQQANFSEVKVRNFRVPNNILFQENLENGSQKSVFIQKDGLTAENDSYNIDGRESGIFITADIQKSAAPMLRTTFAAENKKVSKARLYITARGIYEVYMNGKRVGDDYFNPGLTQYNKHHMYQTYDVTDYLKTGQNALGAVMSEGWWSGAVTYMGYLWNLFGDRQSLLAKLEITYADGAKDHIVSHPDTWKYFNEGAVVYSSFFQGEVYDAQKELLTKGWSETAYNDSAWKNAVEINPENSITEDFYINANRMPAVNDFSEMKLIGQYGQKVQKISELTAIAVEEVRPGVYIYDMGQNMVGVPRISLSGQQPGRKITLRYAEVKYPDLPEFKESVGMIMLENIRGALAQDIYITKGGNEVINPRFTFHGYRYLEITGIDQPLPLKAVKGDVLSSVHQLTSDYHTSNVQVNKLWENITWSTRGNFLSIPTDCPQRNERMGWGGDISVFSRTATYLADAAQFLRRHMLAMRDTQREDGRFADVSPIGGGFGGMLWGSAGITVAWESYLQYNDTEMLAEHYDAMKAYINYLLPFIDENSGILTEGNLGDWLGPEQHKNDNSLLWETYFIYDLELMQRIATILNKDEDAAQFANLHKERKDFFNNTYFDSETGKTVHSGFGQPDKKGELIDTQTSYILPLAFNICSPDIKDKAEQNLIDCLSNETKLNENTTYPPFSLMTGFIGTAWINRVLSDLGHSDLAYRLLQQKTYPSWLYSVEQGATTIWERLNSYTKEHGFSGNNSMNSFNHYSFGAIGSWMCNYSLGIERDENFPGFKQFVLKPEPDPTGQMSSVKGHYDSMYGRIESSWKVKENTVDYIFNIPANTTAMVYLNADSGNDIKENNKSLDVSKDIEFMGKENGKVILKVKSGNYFFSVSGKTR